MTRTQHSNSTSLDLARALMRGFAFVVVLMTMSIASAEGPSDALERPTPSSKNRAKSASGAKLTPAKTNFVNTCERKIKANVRGKKDRANLICKCIVNNLGKKIDDSRIEIITKSYQGRLDEAKVRKTHPDIDITFEFEMEIAESCLEDPKYEIGIEG